MSFRPSLTWLGNTLASAALLSAVIYVLPEFMEPPPQSGTALKLPSSPISMPDVTVLGSPNADVGIIEFSDFECEYCREFALRLLPVLKQKYIDPGVLLFQFRHLPNPAIHPHAALLSRAADCAARQGRFWEMHDELYDSSNPPTHATLAAVADKVRLNRPQFDECLARSNDERILKDREMGDSLGIAGTPTFLIGRRLPHGLLQVSKVMTAAGGGPAFDQAIAEVLADRVHTRNTPESR